MYDPFASIETTTPAPASTPVAFDIGFALDWVSAEARHRDCLFLPWLMTARDAWPDAVRSQLAGMNAGAVVEGPAPGLVPAPDPAGEVELPRSAFNRRLRRHRVVEPHAGRFYPRAFIAGHAGIESGDRELFRIGALEGERLVAELNHPLAGTDVYLKAHVLAAHEHGRDDDRVVDVARLLTTRGPGMQARWRGQPTDFWSGGACEREDPAPDHEFYAGVRLVHHLDATARARIAELYATLIAPGARVLDLMSSWASHLDRLRQPDSVIGLGMNHEELAANPLLGQALVHDLNQQPAIPLPSASVDAVVCTASVEYLTQPEAVFASVREVLRPGGVFVVTFSDRCFPTKAIAVWGQLYDFERMGLVLDLFLRAGFEDLATFSLRGLPRPSNDPYAGRLDHADPVFAVWGRCP